MRFLSTNEIVENVLTDEQIETIYKNVENSHNSYVMELFSQNISDFVLPKDIERKIITKCQTIGGESDLEITEYQFSRYKKTVLDSGETIYPNLTPHADQTFQEPRFTFDYQIGGNTTWPIVVEGKSFTLQNNQALTFSGTNQVHWREPKDFADDEYVDMIFFHLRKRGSGPLPEEIKAEVSEKIAKYKKIYEEEIKNA